MKLTPEQYIKKAILLEAQTHNEGIEFYREYENDFEEWVQEPCELSAENIDEIYDDLRDEFDEVREAEHEFRSTGEDTGLVSSSSSRHYDCEEVGTWLEDDVWVGWTYWYGGGKFGEPESIDWMSNAYFLDVKEEERVVVVRDFSKKEA